MTYKELVQSKTYDEMTDKEIDFCIATETNIYLPEIERLRREGKEDFEITAYLQDLYDNYLIYDDVVIANAAEISDDDWAKGTDYAWSVWDGTNPLK